MACGATLKRPMEFEAALLSPGSPKRRRCAPLPGSTPGLRSPDAEPPPSLLPMQTPPPALQQSAPPGSERRLPTPGSSWMKKDQPTFTLRQVGIICERLLKDYEDKIREEYEQILNTKLAEQYESFVKFTHDQIMRRYGTRPTSYVS
ncbi:PREDICTED: akirin-1 isoform X3 [Chrysochloris asiatica]|uniref:Akirin-1 isoform X3 n=1 Tax=Chrysochloris asiatica TaxID=185453 RepID=A0A9B0WUN7_CHRAS|nr:PREDICTED: akirin-1 isoform X3 [Chrysochloris asiatica]